MQGVGAAGDGPAGAFGLGAGGAEVQGGQVEAHARVGVLVEVDDPPVGGEGDAQAAVVDGPAGVVVAGAGGVDGIGGGVLDGQQQGGAEQAAQQGSDGSHDPDGYQTTAAVNLGHGAPSWPVRPSSTRSGR